MKKNIITVLIGILGTILTLAGALGAMYFASAKTTLEAEAKMQNNNTVSSKSEEADSYNLENKTATSLPNNISTSNSYEMDKVVTLYLFHGSTCPHCLHAKEFLNSIVNNYDYLKIKTIEVWGNKQNSELMDKVAEKLNTKASGVPFMVIGDNYNHTGYSENTNTLITNAIEQNYNNVSYKDIVEEVINENPNLEIVIEDFN